MSSERGFTLVEVMVALAIVALALTAMATSMNTMMRLAGELPEVGTNSGELEYAGTQWEWRTVISETGVDSFMRIDVSVSFLDSDYEIRTITGFVGLPPGRNVANSLWQTTPGGGLDGATK
jgi:general secretion pathway protein I